MKKEKKRQYTKQVFLVEAADGTGMACRLIKNKKKGRPFDVIEILIKGRNSDPILFWVSPDEALQIAWGLTKSVYHFLEGFEPYHRFREKDSKYKYGKDRIWWSI